MTVDLTKPLDDTVISNHEKHFMRHLQANILKGHGREHVVLLLLGVREPGKAREFLRGYPVTDALTQLEETRAYQRSGTPGGVVRLVFLSKAGLDIFDHGDKFTGFDLFSGGMAADTRVLDHGSTESWQDEFTQTVHVMLLLAHHNEIELARIAGKMVADFESEASAFDLVFVQEGRAYRNGDGEGVEHFGYVDGRSQPLMLKSAIEDERNNKGGIDQYDPSAPLGQFVLPDPLDPNAYGSFFVFRKLEQDVAGFKRAESQLADLLNLGGAQAERAGADVVGRFEDGTPVTLRDKAKGVPVRNNFNYEHDQDGARCPFHAHIRKSHPRGSSPGGLEFDKSVQMARRGITYGSRLQDPDTMAFIDKPNDGVGLLFMSYQASLEKQFQFMQTRWVNDQNFPHANIGVDTVIGQGGTKMQAWFPTYGSPDHPKSTLFHGFVTLKGGEYFFTPSVSGLRSI